MAWGGARPGAGRKPNPNKPVARAAPKLKPSTQITVAAEPRSAPAIDPRAWAMMLPEIEEISKKYSIKQDRTAENNPFRLPVFPKSAVPKDEKLTMAFDDALTGNLTSASDQWLTGGSFWGMPGEGLLFLGYTYLSELAQRPEYRVMSETIADDATRKWIDFDVVGDEQQQREQQKKDPAGFDEQMADPDERQKRLKKSGKLEKVKALKDDQLRLEVKDRFYEQFRGDGFFGRMHLFLDIRDPAKGNDINQEELKSPIGDSRDATSKTKCQKGWFQGLRSVEPVWTYPLMYNAINPIRKDWYSPQTWYVMGQEIHGTRLQTFIGHPVPDMLKPAYSFGGLSLTQMAKPYVDIWLQTRQSVAQLIHSFSVMVLMTDLSTLMQPGNVGALLARVTAFNMLRDNQGTYVVNKNTEDFKNVSASLSGLHELQAQAQEHMACLVAGTFIETDRGQVPIEEVTLADQVLTRAGFHPIKWVGVTGRTDTLIEIRAGGSVIAATKDHPIWSESAQEFVDAENVSRSHRLLKSTSAGNMGLQSFGAADGGGTPKRAITETKRLAACFIASCGKRIAALSLMATKFTTSMTTVRTTIGTISSYLLGPSIWPVTSGPTSASTSNGARLAEIDSPPLWLARCFALARAKPEPAKSATAGSRPPIRDLARRAQRRSRPGDPTLDFALAPACSVRVSRVSEIKVPMQPVYNIEVDGPHEFFANGLLVHNSVHRIPLVKFTGIQPSGLNACLPGDTLISTDRGQVQIRDVTLADRVMTRAGLAPLIFSGITEYANELIEITTESTVLRCTANHPIWLPATNEFVRAENVRHGDRLLLIGERNVTPKTRRQSHGAGSGGGKMRTATISLGMPRRSGRCISTAGYGKRIAGLFQTVSTSTILTAIKKTISPPILNRCTGSFTPSITVSKLALGAGGLSLPSPCFARSAGWSSSSQNFRAKRNFAATPASSQIDEQTGSLRQDPIRFALASCAGWLSARFAKMPSSARANVRQRAKTAPNTVGRIISRILKNGEVVPNRVVSVRKIPASEPVYDLSVAPGHLPEFFANGILTHNSSEGEIKTYDDTIAALQSRFADPNLRRIINFQQLSLWGEIDPEITHRWEKLREMTLAEKGQKEKDDADRNQKYVDMGSFSPGEVRKIVIEDPDLPFTGLDPDDVPEPPADEGLLGPGAGGAAGAFENDKTGDPETGAGGEGGE